MLEVFDLVHYIYIYFINRLITSKEKKINQQPITNMSCGSW